MVEVDILSISPELGRLTAGHDGFDTTACLLLHPESTVTKTAIAILVTVFMFGNLLEVERVGL